MSTNWTERHHQGVFGPGGGYLISIWVLVSRWGFQWNPDPIYDKKDPKIHTLFTTKEKMHAVLFWRHLLAIATEQIHVIVIAFVYEIHLGNQIDRAGNTILTDVHEIIYSVWEFRTDSHEMIYPD